MLVNETEQYLKRSFENEAEIETVVQKYSEQLFGPNSIYLSQARISTVGGAGTVPDAVVIDVEGGEWYIVEAERAAHGTWQHIAPQVSRQLAAVAAVKTKEAILQLALHQVSDDESTKQIFVELGIEEIGIHQRLLEILRKDPTIAIPIDAIPKDLREWILSLRHRAKIWVIEKYISTDDPTRVFYSLPDENLPTLATRATSTGKVSTVTRGPSLWRDLLDTGVINDGMPLRMVYGPRGQPKQTLRALLGKRGLR